MSDIPQHLHTAVIGAGAAGIAAGRELRRRGVSFVILEARGRLGGRAWTVPHGHSAPLDLGCEWLHSGSRNVLAALAQEHGFTLDKSDPPWLRPSKLDSFSEDEAREFSAAYAVFDERLAQAAGEAERTGRDHAASEFLKPGSRWNIRFDAIATFYHGAPLDRVSILDYGRYIDTGENWRVLGGYGAMIAALGADLPVLTGCRVTHIDTSGRRIQVMTNRGQFACANVIVSVPSNVLASGAIGFTPALDAHMHAAANLPLGIADKLYLALEDAGEFEPDTRISGQLASRDAGSYTLRPGGRPMIEGYFGGDYARHLEAGGLEAFAAVAYDDLARVLGTGIRRRLIPLFATGWAHDPLSLGSYSHALPGHAESRAALATPVENRIFFAGEAVSRTFFSTAHGAYETGMAAGRAAAAA